jgi:hypothetical protein
MDLEEDEEEDMDWIHLAQDRDKWQAAVDIVRDLHVPRNVRSFLTR